MVHTQLGQTKNYYTVVHGGHHSQPSFLVLTLCLALDRNSYGLMISHAFLKYQPYICTSVAKNGATAPVAPRAFHGQYHGR